MDIQYLVGLVIIIAAVAAVVKFGFLKKDPVQPSTGTNTGQTGGNIFDGGSVSGVTVYEVYAPAGGQPGDVTYTDASGTQVTATITPPSIRISAKDGTAIDGNYGIIKTV